MRKLTFTIFALCIGATAQAQWDGGNNGGVGRQIVTCQSQDIRQTYCPVNGPVVQVRMLRQRSNAPCIQGRTWNYDRGGIYVAGGCRADFEVFTQWDGGDNGGNYSEDIRCASDGRPVLCRTRYQVVDARMIRGNRNCRQRNSWGIDRRGIWTDYGCAGIFRAYYR
jgi:hypothetical protein